MATAKNHTLWYSGEGRNNMVDDLTSSVATLHEVLKMVTLFKMFDYIHNFQTAQVKMV